MHCQACGVESQPGFKFCPGCGQSLVRICPGCEAPCAAEFKFCPSCGGRLAEPGIAIRDLAATRRAAAEAGLADGERRTVTMLFADLSGFTTLSETLDPEEVAVLVNRCLEAMAEVVDRYEGMVDKYIGDCVMALFGAPIAHEDDPQRAIQAGLEMCERVAAIGRALASEHPGRPTEVPISLHVGINTGEVVAGAFGGERRREYTVVGDAVNVAARLDAAAGSGQVLVGEQTYSLARDAFAFEPLGLLTVKGRTEPLAAYRVLGVLAAGQNGRLSVAGLAAPFVGRQGELAQLRTAIDAALGGQAQLVSIVGEAGVGKSRLLWELLERLLSEGLLVSGQLSIRRASCSSRGQQPYGLLAALFRDAYGVEPDDPPATARQKVVQGLAELRLADEEAGQTALLIWHLLGLEPRERLLPHLEPEQLKRQLFLAVLGIVDRRLEHGPLLLIAEDVHWADPASVQLLRFLLERLAGRAFALLVAHRPGFQSDELRPERSGVGHLVVALETLSADESWKLLAGCLGEAAERLPEPLRALAVERSGGNPLYLEEVLRGLIESGALERGPDGWRYAAELGSRSVPGTIQGLLLARLDRLPVGPRRLLQEAAVLGWSVDERLLRAIQDAPDSFEASLDGLLQGQLLVELPRAEAAVPTAERRFRFGHALLQEAAYGSLLLRRRVELHGRAAATLERLVQDRAPRLEELEALGYHFSQSAEKLRGARYLAAAGDWARDSFANEDAARYYQRALETLEACGEAAPPADHQAVRERLGTVLEQSGRGEDALGHYLGVLQACEASGDMPAQARLRRRIGALLWAAGERDRALGYYQSALTLLEGGPEHVEQAQLFGELGRLAFRGGEHRQAIEWARRALTLADQLRPADEAERAEATLAAAQAHNTLGIALARQGDQPAAVTELEAALAVALEHQHFQAACRAYANLGVLYSILDPARAISTSLAGLELARKIGHLGLQPWLYANLAGAYCTFTGQCEADGIAAAQSAVDLDRRLGQLDHLAVPLIVLAQIHQCHGEPEQAFEHYQEALRLAEEMREPQLLFPCYEGLATLYLEVGEQQLAEQYLRRGQAICEQAGLDPDSLVVLPFLG